MRNRRQRCQRVGDDAEKRQRQTALAASAITEPLEAQGFVLLPILPRHLEAVRSLACAHTDPFDRLLIAQAQDERLTLLTRDAVILGLGLDGVLKG
jgi:PIN domain nuclease of toxin-antitoxin system